MSEWGWIGLLLVVCFGFILLFIHGGTKKCEVCGKRIPAQYKRCSECMDKVVEKKDLYSWEDK